MLKHVFASLRSVPPDYYERSIRLNPLQRFWHHRRFCEIKQFTLDLHPRKILDVGCAGGLFTRQLESFFPGAEITGVDVDAVSVAYAAKKYPKMHFTVAAAEALPFPDRSYDNIYLLEVLEHLEDPVASLKEAGRCLTDGGSLIVLVPNSTLLFRWIWFFWIRSFGRVWRESHLHEFREEDLVRLMPAAGLRMVKRRSFLLKMLLVIRAIAI